MLDLAYFFTDLSTLASAVSEIWLWP